MKRFSRLVFICFFFGFLVQLSVTNCLAQPTADSKAKENEPEKIELEIKDGLLLTLNYYKSAKGKDAAVILILHQEKGDRQKYDALAKELKSAGFAVVVPDLRGHGDSNNIQVKKLVGGEIKVDETKKAVPSGLRKQDLDAIITLDLEKVKNFMIARHNKGEFNIRKLCVLGVEMGATIGLNWATLVDWEWPNITTGPQGKDVRGLILISPLWNYKTVNMSNAMSKGEYLQQIPALVMVGNKEKDNPTFKVAERVNDSLKRHHPQGPKDKDKDKDNSKEKEKEKAKQTLYFKQLDTSLQGYALLSGAGRQLQPDPVAYIIAFVNKHVFDNGEEWETRKMAN